MSRDDSKVVEFPKSEEVTPEERARRLTAEVQRLVSLPVSEWLFYLESDGLAEKHGISRAAMKDMVEATIKEREKRAREDKAEDRHREQRGEKEQAKARKEEERKRREQKREQDEQRCEQERAAKEEERKRKERAKELAAIAKLPRLAHEIRLAELAKRLGEDLDYLREEFMIFIVSADTNTKLIEPWDEPVDTQALLINLMAQLRRFVILNDDAAVGVTLWILFSWVHEIATHSPLLVVTSAEPDSGKSTLLGVLGFLTPRSYFAVEMTGPNVYRLVDHLRPTLIIDEADQLFHRKTDLTHIINSSWTKGAKIPRMVRGGEIYEFDPFCPKAIGMMGLALPGTTASRAIVVKLWPKLPSEQTADFRHVDDDEFVVLRRKCMRWAADNAAAFKEANPAMPPGFSNRLAMNWRLPLAIADLAGSTWPNQARIAAIKLSHKRHQSSEGKRLLAAFQKMFGKRAMLTSKEVVKQLIADQAGEWADFRGRGPITERQVSLLLDDYDIHPDVMHPPGRPSARGYKAEWFAQVFARLLLDNRTTVRSRETSGESS
jgi:hypothetical protein